MNRRKFIISSGGILATINILNKDKSSIVLASNDLDIPSRIEYGYREDNFQFQLFNRLNVNVTRLLIETDNIEYPQNTEIQLSASTEKTNFKMISEDIISNMDKSVIPQNGSIDIADYVDLSINIIDKFTDKDFNIDGTTTITLKFIVKNNSNESKTVNSFELDIFKVVVVRDKLFKFISNKNTLESGFTDNTGELSTDAWDIIPSSESLNTDDSLV